MCLFVDYFARRKCARAFVVKSEHALLELAIILTLARCLVKQLTYLFAQNAAKFYKCWQGLLSKTMVLGAHFRFTKYEIFSWPKNIFNKFPLLFYDYNLLEYFWERIIVLTAATGSRLDNFKDDEFWTKNVNYLENRYRFFHDLTLFLYSCWLLTFWHFNQLSSSTDSRSTVVSAYRKPRFAK